MPGEWVGWSLCSAIPGLGTITKGLGLEVYGARTLTGVAQFTDQALRVHRKFGRMRVVSAVLDLHPVPHTLVYRTDVHEDDADGAPTWMDAARDLAVPGGDAGQDRRRRPAATTSCPRASSMTGSRSWR